MAKKASKPTRLIRSSRADLDRLPQFEPDRILNFDETKEERLPLFSESRARQIRNILTAAMKDHVREASFQGKPTSLKRFLDNAMLAIAMYEHRSLRRRGLVLPGGAQVSYDRGRASKLVKEAHVALLSLQRVLERIVEWKQLDRYLEMFFVAARKQNERQRDEREGRRPVAKLSVRALRQLKQGDQYRAQFRARSPRGILNQLRLLDPLLTLALEKLEFQPGDSERDEIAREFADAMVVAWKSATGAVPTISKSKPLPFQRLLATINRDILKAEIRNRANFQHHAISAVGRARKSREGRDPPPA